MQDADTLQEESEGQWISISDVMSVTMMIFMFLTVIFMATVQADKESIEEIARTYKHLRESLRDDLDREFKGDWEKWGTRIDPITLSIPFRGPEISFDQGEDELKDKFKNILIDFFPRYVRILTGPKYKDDIEEVRIEGHTSSEWDKFTDSQAAYFNNMKLSQQRTRVVLEFVMNLDEVSGDFEWLKKRLTANGLSSSKPVKKKNGDPDEKRSRRVEFRVRTNAEKRLVQILTRKGEP